jgi:hypothetical protein
MIQGRDEAEWHAGRARPDSDASGSDVERIGLSLDVLEEQMDLVQHRLDHLRPSEDRWSKVIAAMPFAAASAAHERYWPHSSGSRRNSAGPSPWTKTTTGGAYRSVRFRVKRNDLRMGGRSLIDVVRDDRMGPPDA